MYMYVLAIIINNTLYSKIGDYLNKASDIILVRNIYSQSCGNYVLVIYIFFYKKLNNINIMYAYTLWIKKF